MEKITTKEERMIMESILWLIGNRKAGVNIFEVVGYVNELLIHSASHVKVKLNSDNTIDFV